MWDMLCASTLVLALFVFLPAYVLLRAFGIGRICSLAVAPLVASSVYSLETIIYAKTGILSSWTTVVVPFAAVCAIAFAVSRFLRKRRNGTSASEIGSGTSGARLALFLAFGCIACACSYIAPLESAESFICGNDIVHHLSLNLSFLESGNWSTLETTTTPGGSTGFYPSLWNLSAALAMSALGVSPIVATHATNILIIAVIYPLGTYLLAEALFEGKPLAVCMMGALSLAFLGFPWELLLRKTLLYPNLLGFALMPSVLALTVQFAERRPNRAGTLKLAALIFAGFCALALAHPNTLFTALIFVAALVIHRAVRKENGRSLKVRIAMGAALTVAFIVLWVGLGKAPFMQSIVSNPYGLGTESFLIGGLARIAVLKSPHLGTQALLAVLVVAGFLSLFRRGEKHWIAAPFAIMALLYSLSISLEPSTLKSMLTGFWYNHPTRVFASATLFAIPLAAQGANLVISLLCRLFKRFGSKGSPDASASNSPSVSASNADGASAGNTAARCGQLAAEAKHQAPAESPAANRRGSIPGLGITAPQAATGALIALAAFALPLPLPQAATALDAAEEMRSFYDPNGETSFFTQAERDFMADVAETVPEGSRILNMPNDGSAFSYALYGLNVSGRDFYNSETCPSAEGSQILERIEAGKASSRELAEAGFDFVVVLDGAGDKDPTIYQNRYDESQWQGILDLDEQTPGFEVVLERDGMALYKVTSIEKD